MNYPELAAGLERRLLADAADCNIASDWYDGNQPLPKMLEKCGDQYKRLVRSARTNWAALVVDAAADRLFVEGFAFADTNDMLPWDLWQASDMDAGSSEAILEALICGRAPMMVTLDGGDVRITPEDPRQVIVKYASGSGRRVRTAALKRFIDDWGYSTVELMLPGELIRWRSAMSVTVDGSGGEWFGHSPMVLRDPEVLIGPAVVPIVELHANARVGRSGRSELAGAFETLGRIDKLTADMMLAAEYGAFRQRWATGLEVPRDDTGNPIEPFAAAINRLWVSESDETKFGDFESTSLAGYLDAIKDQVHFLAAIKKTPPHYLLSGMTNLSADAIKAAEASLVSRVQRHQRAFAEAFEQLIRLALSLIGDPRANDRSAQTIWRNSETRTMSERADALTKLKDLIPEEVLWEMWGFTPQEIERMRRLRLSGLFTARVAEPGLVLNA